VIGQVKYQCAALPTSDPIAEVALAGAVVARFAIASF
jgi:hypothetical protein